MAVVYAVMLETGFNTTEYGKGILGACFINDLGTVLVPSPPPLLSIPVTVVFSLFVSTFRISAWPPLAFGFGGVDTADTDVPPQK